MQPNTEKKSFFLKIFYCKINGTLIEKQQLKEALKIKQSSNATGVLLVRT
jgi:hypothetical protein